jgi:Putative zinc-finger
MSFQYNNEVFWHSVTSRVCAAPRSVHYYKSPKRIRGFCYIEVEAECAKPSRSSSVRSSLLFRRRHPLACQQVVELVTGYLEDALSAGDRRRFETHLRHCPHCTEYLDQMRTIIRLTGKLTTEDLSPEVQDKFLVLFKRWSSENI